MSTPNGGAVLQREIPERRAGRSRCAPRRARRARAGGRRAGVQASRVASQRRARARQPVSASVGAVPQAQTAALAATAPRLLRPLQPHPCRRPRRARAPCVSSGTPPSSAWPIRATRSARATPVC